MVGAGTAHIRVKPLVSVSILLGIVYGLFMGLYSVLTRTSPCYAQLFASAIKVPALFVLTLVVTFPSLYVFSALLGVRLGPKDTLRLILAPVAVNLAVLASLGPITGFFTLSTSSYPFMKLLNFLFFAVSGIIGLKVLLTMLSRLEAAQAEPAASDEIGPAAGQTDSAKPAPAPAQEGDVARKTLLSRLQAAQGDTATSSEIDSAPGQTGSAQPMSPPPMQERSVARRTFQIWLVIYALVGAQMGWVLRPFVGDPNLPFELFRAREANIFVDVVCTIGTLFGQ